MSRRFDFNSSNFIINNIKIISVHIYTNDVFPNRFKKNLFLSLKSLSMCMFPVLKHIEIWFLHKCFSYFSIFQIQLSSVHKIENLLFYINVAVFSNTAKACGFQFDFGKSNFWDKKKKQCIVLLPALYLPRSDRFFFSLVKFRRQISSSNFVKTNSKSVFENKTANWE